MGSRDRAMRQSRTPRCIRVGSRGLQPAVRRSKHLCLPERGLKPATTYLHGMLSEKAIGCIIDRNLKAQMEIPVCWEGGKVMLSLVLAGLAMAAIASEQSSPLTFAK